jgi:hypothetical protein
MDRRIIALGLIGICLTAFAQPASAYIDPGSGSIILQSIIGGVATCLVAGKLFWAKLKQRIFPGSEAHKDSAGRDWKNPRDRSTP